MGILVRVIVYCHKDWGRSHNAITACPCGAKSIFEYLSSAYICQILGSTFIELKGEQKRQNNKKNTTVISILLVSYSSYKKLPQFSGLKQHKLKMSQF